MNRMFDDVFRGFDLAPFGPARALDGFGWPQIDIDETDKGCASPPNCPVFMRKTSASKSQMAFFRSPAKRKLNPKTRPVVSASGTTAASNGVYRCRTSTRT